MVFRLLILFLGFGSNQLFSQALERSLAGFAIGQNKEIPSKVLGKPYLADTNNLGNQIEAFTHPMGEGWVVVFEYAKESNHPITSIQLSSQKEKMMSGFYGLSFGMTQAEVLKIAGKPSDKISIGEYGEKWMYEAKCFSVDINKQGKLWAIKLFEPNYQNIVQPSLNIPEISTLINLKSNAELAAYLSPSLKIISSAQTLHFKSAWNVEIENDASFMFTAIKLNLLKIISIEKSNPKLFKQAIIPEKIGPSKFKTSYKLNQIWLEIIWAYEFGSYRIIEIKM